MRPIVRSFSAVLLLRLASCAAPVLTPPPLHDGASGTHPLPVTVTSTGFGSPWAWRIDTPEGPWRLTCRYQSEGFTAALRFPGGKSLILPGDAVTAACRAISEAPEAAAWSTADGTTCVSIGGTITLTTSQGIFAIRDQQLHGYELSETNAGQPGGNSQRAYAADGTPITP